MSNIPYQQLWKEVTDQFAGGPYSVHGPDHWRRVERNGLLIAASIPFVDHDVVRLFALFHDSRRIHDGHDEGHGRRGAEYLQALLGREVQGRPFEITDFQFETLFQACTLHTDCIHHENETIGCCLDADRLDLPRVGIETRAEFLNTDFGKQIANAGGMESYVARNQFRD